MIKIMPDFKRKQKLLNGLFGKIRPISLKNYFYTLWIILPDATLLMGFGMGSYRKY